MNSARFARYGCGSGQGADAPYTVESILELLSSGMAIEQVLADYEDLEREDILAALDFARQLSQIKRIEPIVA
jgi:uncharacterized protein (DUF433 family)